LIRILFFGPIAEQADARELHLEFLPGIRLRDVVQQMQERHAHAFGLVSFIAVNSTQIRDMDLLLNDRDEIAFMAKFSGG
jgi:molybdopterin converting factor small subunit